MNKKLFYTQPTTDLIELRVEGLVCQSNYGDSQAAGLAFSSENGNITTIDIDF